MPTVKELRKQLDDAGKTDSYNSETNKADLEKLVAKISATKSKKDPLAGKLDRGQKIAETMGERTVNGVEHYRVRMESGSTRLIRKDQV